MKEALKLAALGRGTVSPNPMVGAVVVRKGAVVGRGYHRQAGEPHAEVFALEEAGRLSAGSTLYVTLEPCCHRGRTGPCTERIIDAGVSRVEAAVTDPFPAVSGRGIRTLRNAGIRVGVGNGGAEARALNEAYFFSIERGRPWVDLKMAATLDGKIADGLGVSKWITGARSRGAVHRLRWGADAILAGAGTIVADDPRLTARSGRRTREPLRVILDTGLRTVPSARILTDGDPALVRIASLRSAPRLRRTALESAGATVWTVGGSRAGGVSIEEVLKRLHGEGVRRLLVEGGGETAGSFLRMSLVERLHYFVAPRILGRGRDAFSGLGDLALDEALDMSIVKIRRHGEDIEFLLEPGGKQCSPD